MPQSGIALALVLMAGSLQAIEPCAIEVVEKGTGWPVPLIQLRTVHQTTFVTDNAGRIAFDLPELMDHETWFDVIGHGYEVPKDGLGFRGVRLKPQSGGNLRIEVRRTMVAKRLGRITGAGLFAETRKLGLEPRIDDSGIVGCDSIQNAVHQGRLYWLWGDTSLARYPLGIFDCSSATTPLQPLSSFRPPIRIDFHYFTNELGVPRGVAPMKGEGPTWITGYSSLKDGEGRDRLVASFMKIRPPLQIYQWGLCVWNETARLFESNKVIWTQSETSPKAPPMPEGHSMIWKDADGKSWLLMGNPLPKFRCPANFEAWRDPATWEWLTPPKSLASAENNLPVTLHSGSIAWNAFRGRWVTVFMQTFGKPSAHGELWYAEAASPLGPWGKAVKVLTHENYTFYNPKLHPGFTPADSPILLFEGTYTQQFADHAVPTPRYEYNQILYRLDLDDPALKPAQRQPEQ